MQFVQAKFKHALAPRDQRALDELWVYARQHLAESAYAANPLCLETFMMAMLLEMHKEVLQLDQVLGCLNLSIPASNEL